MNKTQKLKFDSLTEVEKDKHDFDIDLNKSNLDHMRPANEVLPPELFKMLTRGKQKAPTKVSTTVRFEKSTIDFFKKTGNGWQTRMNDVLSSYVKSHS